jgi:hypothetical protein
MSRIVLDGDGTDRWWFKEFFDGTNPTKGNESNLSRYFLKEIGIDEFQTRGLSLSVVLFPRFEHVSLTKKSIPIKMIFKGKKRRSSMVDLV